MYHLHSEKKLCNHLAMAQFITMCDLNSPVSCDNMISTVLVGCKK